MQSFHALVDSWYRIILSVKLVLVGLLAPPQRAAAAARPLAHADRCAGDRFRKSHAGRRFRGAVIDALSRHCVARMSAATSGTTLAPPRISLRSSGLRDELLRFTSQ